MLGQLIKAWRKDHMVSVRGAADIFDVLPSTIVRIEKGKPVDQETMLNLINVIFTVAQVK